MVNLLITLLILCVVGGLLWWAINALPLPHPFKTIALVVLVVIFVIVLLGFLPVGPWRWQAA